MEQENAVVAAPVQAVVMAWVPVSERMPEPGIPVLAFVREAETNWTRRIRAFWAPAGTIEGTEEDEHNACEYDEGQDAYYLREGWYEKNEYEEVNWMVAAPVTHWMPLPPGP